MQRSWGLALVGVVMAVEQAATIQVTGTVQDMAGAGVAGASVQMRGAGGVGASAMTRGDGSFSLRIEAVRSYTVEVSAPGFVSVTRALGPGDVAQPVVVRFERAG